MATDSTTAITVKLLIDTTSKKVLFAEAGKDFIDFLFSLTSLPLSTVTRLLTAPCMVGSVGNLYRSIESLSEQYMQSTGATQGLTKPKATLEASAAMQILPREVDDCETKVTKKWMYKCSYRSYNDCSNYITDVPGKACPRCRHDMTTQVELVGGAQPKVPAGEGGFVKGVVTYMITDDLMVTPMSTISCISIINKFNIKEFGALEEKTFHLDIDQGLKLLKASLQSKTVLTSVFLGD